jgi:hypothetical protein
MGTLDAGGAKAPMAEPGLMGAVFEALEVLRPPRPPSTPHFNDIG